MAGEPGVIEWSRDPADSRLLLFFGYVPIGVLGGLVLFAVAMVLFGAVLAVASGNLFTVGLILLLTLVGGPFSLLYLWPLLRHPDQRPPAPDWVGELRPRWVVLASLFGALAIFLSILSGFDFRIVVAIGFVPLLVIWLFTGEGEIDTETRILHYGDGNEIELDAITGVKRLHVGETALLWLSFPRGRPPRPLVLPAETDRAARPVFEQATTRSVGAREPNRTVQAVLVAFALVFYGVAVVLTVRGWATTGGTVRLGYVAVVMTFFGTLFAVTAVYGT